MFKSNNSLSSAGAKKLWLKPDLAELSLPDTLSGPPENPNERFLSSGIEVGPIAPTS